MAVSNNTTVTTNAMGANAKIIHRHQALHENCTIYSHTGAGPPATRIQGRAAHRLLLSQLPHWESSAERSPAGSNSFMQHEHQTGSPGAETGSLTRLGSCGWMTLGPPPLEKLWRDTKGRACSLVLPGGQSSCHRWFSLPGSSDQGLGGSCSATQSWFCLQDG